MCETKCYKLVALASSVFYKAQNKSERFELKRVKRNVHFNLLIFLTTQLIHRTHIYDFVLCSVYKGQILQGIHVPFSVEVTDSWASFNCPIFFMLNLFEWFIN